MTYPPLYVACALCAIAAVAERLGRTAIGSRIGGATTIMPIAGGLGNALGTYAGFLMVYLLSG